MRSPDKTQEKCVVCEKNFKQGDDEEHEAGKTSQKDPAASESKEPVASATEDEYKQMMEEYDQIKGK